MARLTYVGGAGGHSCRHRLNWPEGAQSKRSCKAVSKLSTLRKLLSDMGDPSLRSHISNFEDLLRQMLRYDPAKRIRARDALRHAFFTGAVRCPPYSPLVPHGPLKDLSSVASSVPGSY
jgi:dual-specificity kinase